MADVPGFLVRVPMRCMWRDPRSPRDLCGAEAFWFHAGTSESDRAFFCYAHHQVGDQKIPADVLYRRVSLTVEIVLAGTAFTPAAAQAEAVDLVERTLRQVCALVNLHTVTSVIGRFSPAGLPPGGKAGRPHR